MDYPSPVMRRSLVVATAALMAAVALAGLPPPAGSHVPSVARGPQAATLTSVLVTATTPAPAAQGSSDVATTREELLDAALVEPGRAQVAPKGRPSVVQPVTAVAPAWKPARYTVSGQATFYDNGTTAMRLPRGTTVRICGAGGCIVRTVTDYGPRGSGRIVDLYRPDFFRICGCPSFSGVARVTVSVY
jgi:hypothetical protein